MFSEEQQHAFDLFEQGKNIFLTGPGGTGKSKWIRTVHQRCTKKLQVCAMTGCAAVLLDCNAKTLHSWAGIGLGDPSKALQNKFVRDRWRTTDVLIVDEISMMSDVLFDMLNTLGKTIRRSTKPFGGIQLVFCGDFYQLPPVDGQFCFEHAEWKKTFPETVQLTHLFRQPNETYQSILKEIRNGKLSDAYHALLKERMIPGNGCTRLVPTRKKADDINTKEYAGLTGEEHVYTMKVSTTNTYDADALKKNMLCGETIKLKVGTKVMCIVNMEELCNGSQGVVVGFDGFPIVRFAQGDILMKPNIWTTDSSSITQVPLIYAWAITIHKAQGATLQEAELDLGNDVFECGQSYVALSRVVDISGLYLTGFNSQKIKLHPKVVEFYRQL